MKLSFLGLQTNTSLTILVWVQLNWKLSYPYTKEITFLPGSACELMIPGSLEAVSLEIFQLRGVLNWRLQWTCKQIQAGTSWECLGSLSGTLLYFSYVLKDWYFVEIIPLFIFPQTVKGTGSCFRGRVVTCDREIWVAIWFFSPSRWSVCSLLT